MPKSLKIFIFMLIISFIFVPIGLYYNPKPIYKYDIKTNDFNQDKLNKDLKDMTVEEQKKYLSSVSALESKTIHKEDINDYISDKIIYDSNSYQDNTLYIVFSNQEDSSPKIRKKIRKYNKNKKSYPYKIIYQQQESSNLTGLEIYNKYGNQKNKSLNEIPSFFLIENNKIVEKGDNYKELPYKNK